MGTPSISVDNIKLYAEFQILSESSSQVFLTSTENGQINVPCGLLQFAFLITGVYLRTDIIDFHTKILAILNTLWHLFPEHM